MRKSGDLLSMVALPVCPGVEIGRFIKHAEIRLRWYHTTAAFLFMR